MGDEVGALVFDFGSFSLRGGFAGEDIPKLDIPSYLAVPPSGVEKPPIIGPNILLPREKYEIEPFLKDGLIENFDNFEKVLEYMIDFLIPYEKTNHPILMTEPIWNKKAKREKMTEILFEKFNVPAMYIGKNAAMTCFANGRHTGLVLDCGSIHTTAVPVYDGVVLTQATVRSPLAGDFILRQTLKLLESKKIEVVPTYRVASKEVVKDREEPKWKEKKNLPQVSETYDAFMKKMLLTDFMNSVVQISDEKFDQSMTESFPLMSYEFPNGYNIDLGSERFQLPEYLFDPSLLPEACGNSMLSMSHTITSSVSLCEIDIRPSLFSNILVSGGTSSLMGFSDRLQKELAMKTPASMRVKVNVPSSISEKRFSSWVGGSILASLGTFQQMWISKHEYDELGRHCVEKKIN